MFSLTNIDHVAWFLVLMVALWLLASILVDLSRGGKAVSDPIEDSTIKDERSEKRS